MHLLPPENDVVPYETTFENDMLGREKFGKSLSSLVERIEGPLVVALDGRWGTGKSYFLQRWAGAHTISNSGRALTVYFDAFAHDYHSDPLVGLVTAISKRLPDENASAKERIKKYASMLLRPALRAGLAAATSGASLAFEGIGDAVVGSLGDDAKSQIDQLWKAEETRDASMEAFRAAISQVTAVQDDGTARPLVVIVDELDRCRPDYALELLEVVKHFFSVPRVHFVLGVNLHVLESMVSARYGQGIDASAYLQKFITLRSSLPERLSGPERPSVTVVYLDEMGKRMKLPTHLLQEAETQVDIIQVSNPISIREAGKILSRVALMPDDIKTKSFMHGWPRVATTLLIASVTQPKLYKKLVDLSFDDAELRELFSVGPHLVNGSSDTSGIKTQRDREVFYLYHTWRFLQNPNSVADDRSREQISGSFDRFGMREPQLIPGIVERDWLNLFRPID